MNSKEFDKKTGFGSPSIYQIKVAGKVKPDWANRLRGMQLITQYGTDKELETVLTGQVIDQPALAGIVNSLVELHMVILSIKKVD